jgi:hypothetical protein
MRSWFQKKGAHAPADDAGGIEEQLVSVVMQRLRPALDAVFNDLQRQVETLVGAAVERELAHAPRLRRIGEVKHCSGCGLPGSRNFAGLAKDHTQEEHRRWQHEQRAARPTAAQRARAKAAKTSHATTHAATHAATKTARPEPASPDADVSAAG